VIAVTKLERWIDESSTNSPCYRKKRSSTKIKHNLSADQWVVPENIHTHTMGSISEFRRGGGITSTGIPRTWGGSLDWNSEGMGGFSGE